MCCDCFQQSKLRFSCPNSRFSFHYEALKTIKCVFNATLIDLFFMRLDSKFLFSIKYIG